MPFDIAKLEHFPTQPGVYIMKDLRGHVLYIGKAKNLKQRVRQYFISGGDGRPIIPLLVPSIVEIETIIVLSEKEALLLENTLIKDHKPKYNALLKDDKTYVALKINHKHTWPLVQLVRYKGKPRPDGLYFGPHTSAYSAKMTLEFIHKVFPLRQCSDQELLRRTRPCILYDMKRCVAPCVNKCTHEEYEKIVERVIKFLRGQDKEILKELNEEMALYADTLEYEKADAVLKLIRQIENTLEGQHVNKPLGGNADALGIYRQGPDVIIAQLFIRNGKLIGSRHYSFSNIAEEDTELLTSFILQHYGEVAERPEEILVPLELSEQGALSEILSIDHRAVRVFQPQRGDKNALIEMAYLNAEAIFKKEKDLQAIREKTLLEMQEVLYLNQFPCRIECFDNSNLFGEEPVAALVVFIDGFKDPSSYRKYKIKSVTSPDDYATMYEVLLRRYKRAKEEGALPDLVIVDGGKGQLNVALKVFAELNIVTVDIIGLAKEAARHDKGMTAEQIFLPNLRDPILLKKHSSVLHLLQQIRDEAHRFAITFHRKRKHKKTLRSGLEGIRGLGPVKRKALMKHFGSLKAILQASEEELRQVKGISQRNVSSIKLYKNGL